MGWTRTVAACCLGVVCLSLTAAAPHAFAAVPQGLDKAWLEGIRAGVQGLGVFVADVHDFELYSALGNSLSGVEVLKNSLKEKEATSRRLLTELEYVRSQLESLAAAAGSRQIRKELEAAEERKELEAVEALRLKDKARISLGVADSSGAAASVVSAARAAEEENDAKQAIPKVQQAIHKLLEAARAALKKRAKGLRDETRATAKQQPNVVYTTPHERRDENTRLALKDLLRLTLRLGVEVNDPRLTPPLVEALATLLRVVHQDKMMLRTLEATWILGDVDKLWREAKRIRPLLNMRRAKELQDARSRLGSLFM